MSVQQQEPKDHWSSKAYAASASFVPTLASRILEYLDPQPSDRILDIGCGDGKFTSRFIPTITTGEVYGTDNSPRFIDEATAAYASDSPRVHFKRVDARLLHEDAYSVNGSWDKVISNAALHWILCTSDRAVQRRVFESVHASLKKGGRFVFEFGGAGNVAEVVAVTVALLARDGFDQAEIQGVMPWFFPDTVWLRSLLENVGFRVEVCELVDRPTRLNEVVRDEKGVFVGGGFEGWARLMMASVLDAYELKNGLEKKEAFVREITRTIEIVADRTYDGMGEGGMWLRNVRLRGFGTKV